MTAAVNSRGVPYVKTSGCGNVFLLIEQSLVPAASRAETTLHLCSPNGVGADGVEWIAASHTPDADIEALLFNADGSEAEISGNGTRCVAAHWIALHGADRVRVRTGAGVKECNLVSRKGSQFEFAMNVGQPHLQGQLELDLTAGKLSGTRLSVGNPQFVVFVDNFDFDWQKRGAEIQAKRVFMQGTNVDFVRIISLSEIEARFFERGVGETQSSGTGSCASAVAAITAGKAKSPVLVNSVGGAQTVVWEKTIVLRGPAQIEQQGTFIL